MLRHFDVGGNFFEGPIPDWIAIWSHLTVFYAGCNWFSGTVEMFGGCKKLRELFLDSNCLEGELPSSLLPVLAQTDSFSFGNYDPSRLSLEQQQHIERLRKRPGSGNSRLCVTEEARATISFLWE